MMLHKRFDYGSSGCQVPSIHVPKSARGKRSARKKVEENKICAFDLLATVAGQLLIEGESIFSPCSNTRTPFLTARNDILKEEQLIQENSTKTEILDQHSCCDGLLESEVTQSNVTYVMKEQSHASEILASGSALVKRNISNKDTIAEESIVIDHGSEAGYLFSTTSEKDSSEGNPSSSMKSHKYKGEVVKTPTEAERRLVGTVVDVNSLDLYNLKYPMDLDTELLTFVSSESIAEVPDCGSKLPQNSSFPKRENYLKSAIEKDDDENSSGCTRPRIHSNKPSRLQRIGDRRIRKLLASKYWNVAPTVSHGSVLSRRDIETKPVSHGKKMCYIRQWTKRSPFKRKKMLERCPVPNGGIFHKSVSNLSRSPGIKLEQNDPNITLHGVNGASSFTGPPKSSTQSPEYSVKLSISSFKIPELFVEMPETATVGSLKRTITEAATAILGGGFRLGVLLQGKMVQDDNKTLRQSGILHSDKLGNLGFMLESDCTEDSAPLSTNRDPLSKLEAPTELSPRIASISTAPIDEVDPDVTLQLPLTTITEGDHDSFYYPADAPSLDKALANSQAIIAVPPINADAMVVVPLDKSKRSEVVQRRIRRPFSVVEVEALVQYVEKLGTGRWRDVKLRAFGKAKHRTYVDLKDKWKTLVHTAKISPQQRRGEPVPQELLDRVLAAHAYWSQQQAKLMVKPRSADTCLLI